MTLYFTILQDRVSPADFTAAASAALLPYALDQEGPTPPEDFASSRSVVALHFALHGGRASPADLTAAVPSALVVPSAW